MEFYPDIKTMCVCVCNEWGKERIKRGLCNIYNVKIGGVVQSHRGGVPANMGQRGIEKSAGKGDELMNKNNV